MQITANGNRLPILSRQKLLVMKLLMLFTLATCLCAEANVSAQTVTLKANHLSLEKVLREVRKQTGYDFVLNNSVITIAKPITVEADKLALEAFLEKCLQDQPLTYEILSNKTIIIKAQTTQPVPPGVGSLSASFPPPPVDISGRITNAQGESLAGANVIIKRTGRGTITDATGKFALKNVNSDDIIEVTFIGYNKLSIKVGDRSNFTLLMDVATNKLDEVKVQAYGVTSNRLATGNIGRITSQDIEKQPVMNPIKALQGQIAGVDVINTNGYASAPVKLEIRGRNTINPSFPADPLYIVDGVPLTILELSNSISSYSGGSKGVNQSAGILGPALGQSPFFSINPDDIESIEVLKDADATAIYGSRGSNGVVLITTKKGKAGKTNFEVNFSEGISQVTTRYTLLNTNQYINMRKEALVNDQLPIDMRNAADLIAWDTTRYYDWQKFLFGSLGKETNAQASLSGGDIRTNFRIAGGYHYQRDILAAEGDNQRENISFDLNHKSINQKFSIGAKILYSFTKSTLIQMPGNPLLIPDAPPIYDRYGKLNFNDWNTIPGSFAFGALKQPYVSKTNFLNSSLSMSNEIIKGLTLKINLGYNNFLSKQTQIIPIVSQDPLTNPTGVSSYGYNFIHNIIIEPHLEYNRTLGKGKLNMLVGGSYQDNETSGIFSQGINYTNDALLNSVSNAPTKLTGNASGQYKYASLFARFNYNWEDKYIINLSGRRDGSSKFGPDRQFGNFGSVGGAWIFSEEKLFKRALSFVSFGKIRGSYGLVGGDQIFNYQYLTQWSFSNVTYNGNLPLTPTKHTDSLLHWQVNHKLELSLSLGFLNDKLITEVSWYRNNCGDQLVSYPTPQLSGFPSVVSNLPAKVQNSGWEIELSAKIINKNAFKWSMKFNLGANKNKLLAYPNLSQSPYAFLYVIGEPLNIRKVLHLTGVDQQTGLYTFLDNNKDGLISSNPGLTDDRIFVDLTPKYSGGLTTNFSYKNWSASAFFYFKKQIGGNAFFNVGTPGTNSNIPLEIFNNHWQKPGDIVQYAKFTTNPTDPSYSNFYSSDAILTDASFIRLQNLSISYSLAQKWMTKAHLGSIAIWVHCENLFLFTKYKGVDPEIQNFAAIPLPKILTLGLSCKF